MGKEKVDFIAKVLNAIVYDGGLTPEINKVEINYA